MRRHVVIWIVIPLLHYLLWIYIAKQSLEQEKCLIIPNDIENAMIIDNINYECTNKQINECSRYIDENHEITMRLIDTDHLETYRSEMASMNYPGYTTILQTNYLSDEKQLDSCEEIRHVYTTKEARTCFAIYYTNLDNISSINSFQSYKYSIMRYDPDINEEGRDTKDPAAVAYKAPGDTYHFKGNKHNNKEQRRPIGFFRKVPKTKGRNRLHEKLQPFLELFEEINDQLSTKLSFNDIKSGDDLIVMVVNEGEIDLYLNFACSCQQHDISLGNLLVFSGSKEIIDIIESTGAMALYHIGYGSVSKKASMDYLDRTFVDMMWYKAFSVYLILRQGINVLFQDVDLVWFKSPFSYFKDYKSHITNAPIEAFFSDDGQRSLRYAPFYANSGFYYLRSNERSIYFTWSIMTAFDSVQLLGSHQNVFTTRLIEGLGLGYQHTKIIPIEQFPTGFLFHHDKHYMRLLKDKKVQPYHFHMCWTQGKKDKLENFLKASMWYLTDICSPIEAYMGPNGRVFQEVSPNVADERSIIHSILFSQPKPNNIKSNPNKWKLLSNLCCTAMPGAP